jgi:hypothetical protein
LDDVGHNEPIDNIPRYGIVKRSKDEDDWGNAL